MNKKDQLKMIQRAYVALDVLNNFTWTPYRDKLLGLCIDEERQHRGDDFREYHAPDAISIKDAARLFTVRWLAEYVLPNARIPGVKDLLHTKPSVFLAASLALNYGDEIRTAWKDFDVPALAALDYVEFVKKSPRAA